MKTQEECGDAVEFKGRGSFRFYRKERLKGRKDIQAVYGRGRRFGCQGAKLFMLKNNLEYNRICFALPRGFGNSVKRNRARRLGREAYRLLRPRLHGGNDLIFLVFPEMLTIPGFCTKQLEYLFSKAGLLK